jgi:hypothetical protein
VGRGKRDDKARTLRERDIAEGFTVLEKLAVRVLSSRQVPAESGVRFAVSSRAREDGICLVFLVDDREAAIYPDSEGPRPDYLVLHASRDGVILTIVEMKGRTEKGNEHGVEQIMAFFGRLQEEMARCLPGSWRRAHIQGILLMPENAQFNRQKILDARKAGIVILPLSYHHQAELYDYISQPLSHTRRYEHRRLPRDTDEHNSVERLLTSGQVIPRLRDDHFAERRGRDEDTFYLNFRRPGDSKANYVSLAANTREAILAFSPGADALRQEVCAHLDAHDLRCPALRIKGAEPETPQEGPPRMSSRAGPRSR